MRDNETKRKGRGRGGQPGNSNAQKHGFYSKGGKRRFEEVDSLVRDCHKFLGMLVDGNDPVNATGKGELCSFNLLASEQQAEQINPTDII